VNSYESVKTYDTGTFYYKDDYIEIYINGFFNLGVGTSYMGPIWRTPGTFYKKEASNYYRSENYGLKAFAFYDSVFYFDVLGIWRITYLIQ
jgi:hypothetical protein